MEELDTGADMWATSVPPSLPPSSSNPNTWHGSGTGTALRSPRSGQLSKGIRHECKHFSMRHYIRQPWIKDNAPLKCVCGTKLLLAWKASWQHDISAMKNQLQTQHGQMGIAVVNMRRTTFSRDGAHSHTHTHCIRTWEVMKGRWIHYWTGDQGHHSQGFSK